MRVSTLICKRRNVSICLARLNSVTNVRKTLKFASNVPKITGLIRVATNALMPHARSTNVINATLKDQAFVMFVKLVTSFRTVNVLIAIHSLKVCIARVAVASQCAQIVPLATDLKMASASHVSPKLVLSVTSALDDAMLVNQDFLLTNLASVSPAKPPVKNAIVLISAPNVSGRCTV